MAPTTCECLRKREPPHPPFQPLVKHLRLDYPIAILQLILVNLYSQMTIANATYLVVLGLERL